MTKRKPLDAAISLRLPSQAVRLLKAIAKSEGRSLSNYINRVLAEEIKKFTEPVK